MNELTNLMNETCEAHEKGQINKEIEITERLGYYFLAGITAKENGLFKKACENFKKIENYENMNKIHEIVFPKYFLTAKEIQKNKMMFNDTPGGWL